MGDELNELQKELATISANLEAIKVDLSEFKASIRELYTSRMEQGLMISSSTQTMENMKEKISDMEIHIKNCPFSKIKEDLNAVGAKVNFLYGLIAFLGAGFSGLVFKLIYDFITHK